MNTNHNQQGKSIQHEKLYQVAKFVFDMPSFSIIVFEVERAKHTGSHKTNFGFWVISNLF